MVSAKIVPRTNDRRDSSVHMTSAQSGKKSYPTALASTAQLGGQLNHYTLAVQPNAMEDRNYSMMVHVKIVATTKHWLRYKLPKRLIRHESLPVCIGQKQKWFLLQLTAPESAVDLLHSSHPEFDDWRWVSYWYPVRQVVSFKREVYRKVMKEFALAAMPSYRQERRRRRA